LNGSSSHFKLSDYFALYAERFDTVEVDSAFYPCPTARTVENWNARTPDGFVSQFLLGARLSAGHREVHGVKATTPRSFQ
jgi:hypothetical protein